MSISQIYPNSSIQPTRYISDRVTELEAQKVNGPISAIPNSLSYFVDSSGDNLQSSDITITPTSLTIPDTGTIYVDNISPTVPILPGQNYIVIAGQPVGVDAPTQVLTISTPLVASDLNGIKITGSILQQELADNTHPGILSIGNQTIGGLKTFTGGLVTSNHLTSNTGVLNIGASDFGPQIVNLLGFNGLYSTNLIENNIFTSTNGIIAPSLNALAVPLTIGVSSSQCSIDTQGVLDVGVTYASQINIGTQVVTPPLILMGDPAGVCTIQSRLDSNIIDRAGTISMGTNLSTAVSIGRIGINTNLPGTMSVGQLLTATGNIVTNNLDSITATTLNIGITNTNALSISQVGILTTVNGPLLSNGLLSAPASIQTTQVDTSSSAPFGVGGTNANSVLIGKVSSTTTILGPLKFSAGTGTVTSYNNYESLKSFDGCIPVTANAMMVSIQKTDNLCTLSARWNPAVPGVVCTSNASLIMQGNLDAGFRPISGLIQLCHSIINGARTISYATILSDGTFSFFPSGTTFVIGQTISMENVTIIYSVAL